MATLNHSRQATQSGTTLIEVLITMVILAFGLLGIAAFQAKAQVGAIESYQRAQAIVLLEDMQARMRGNGSGVAGYISATPFGTDDSQPDDCAGQASGAPRDVCEWSAALKGGTELNATARVGAMTSARGCITQIQAPDTTAGICRPGVYLVSIAWQGLHSTKASSLTCGKDLYGDDTNRRVIAQRVAIGLPSCN